LNASDCGGLELKQESAAKYIRFTSHNPGIGEGSNTVRLHMFSADRADEDIYLGYSEIVATIIASIIHKIMLLY